MNNEKKTYQTPEAEVILFGEDIITCSGPFPPLDHDGGMVTDQSLKLF